MASNAENISIWWRHHEHSHGYWRHRGISSRSIDLELLGCPVRSTGIVLMVYSKCTQYWHVAIDTCVTLLPSLHAIHDFFQTNIGPHITVWYLHSGIHLTLYSVPLTFLHMHYAVHMTFLFSNNWFYSGVHLCIIFLWSTRSCQTIWGIFVQMKDLNIGLFLLLIVCGKYFASYRGTGWCCRSASCGEHQAINQFRKSHNAYVLGLYPTTHNSEQNVQSPILNGALSGMRWV